MSWETIVSGGSKLIGAFNTTNSGKAQADAIVTEGEQRAQNIADNTVRNIGKLKTSFLQSGIALDDVGGTQAVFAQAAQQGYTDIGRTISNANASAKNTYSAGRSAALDALLKGTGGSLLDGGKEAGDGWLSGGSTWNGLGQETGSWLDPSPVGPYQSPLSSSYWG